LDYLITAGASGEIAAWDVLEFLKEVDSIGQDYKLEGIQPLCTVNLNSRVISL
jgi:hypothetical protein